jgi:undecaprenyl-diphosphatase
MNVFEAMLLGIIQGLTEFLPISSTAHLTLAGRVLGLIDPAHPEKWTSFIAVIQLGTLAAVLVYFLNDLTQMARSTVRDLRTIGPTCRFSSYAPPTRMTLYAVVGTVPIGIIGVLASDALHGMMTKNLLVIAGSLIVLALLLWLAERVAKHERGLDNVSMRDALVVGLAQCLALIPGSSRSGTTLTAGLFLGLTREAAARFSFILSIPAILASGVHEMTGLEGNPYQYGTANLFFATACAAISGYAAIAWLLRFLMSRTTMVFVWYRVILGVVIFWLLFNGSVQP